MTGPEPDSFDALLRELMVERYQPIDRAQPALPPLVVVEPDSPATFYQRRKILNDALTDDYGNVLPMVRRGSRWRAA